jgi:hypothetical protein
MPILSLIGTGNQASSRKHCCASSAAFNASLAYENAMQKASPTI